MCLVDVTTGRLSLEQVDLTLEGPVPLELFRLYRSTGLWLGDLGWGWSHAFGYQLRERDIEKVTLSRGLTQKLLHGTLAELNAAEGDERGRLAQTVTRLFLRGGGRNPGNDKR